MISSAVRPSRAQNAGLGSMTRMSRSATAIPIDASSNARPKRSSTSRSVVASPRSNSPTETSPAIVIAQIWTRSSSGVGPGASASAAPSATAASSMWASAPARPVSPIAAAPDHRTNSSGSPGGVPAHHTTTALATIQTAGSRPCPACPGRRR